MILQPIFERIKHYFMSTRLPLKLLTMQQKQPNSARHMDVYVYLATPSNLVKSQHPDELKHFFIGQAQRLKRRTAQMPIFLQERMAIRHGRFRHVPYVVFKLIVPESAITGRTQSLMVKTEVICPQTIQGCYLGWESPELFLNNPYFTAS